MGLVMNIGLARFFDCDPTEEAWTAALHRIVETGVTDLVRDVIAADPFAGGRVYEARRGLHGVEGRFLTDEEAAPLHHGLAEVASFGRYASWSWDELDELDLMLQSLGVVYDREPHWEPEKVVIMHERGPVRMHDLRQAARQFYGDNMHDLVVTMLAVAGDFRIIVGSA